MERSSRKMERMIFLTQIEINTIYFDLRDYVKELSKVDKLTELTNSQKEIFKTELQLINKFNKLIKL